MPTFSTIGEFLLFTTLRVSTIASDGSSGVGTAFIYLFENDGQSAPFLVTNKHVVKGAATGELLFTQKTADGAPDLRKKYALRVTDFEKAWRGHPDPDVDITIAPFLPLLQHVQNEGVDPYFRTIGDDIAPRGEVLDNLDALEECVFVGYPNDIWDHVNNLPIARRGVTATHPAVDFRGQPVFLLDASVFPGSSGSPVLVYNRGAFPTSKTGAMTVGTRVVFLGVIASVFYREEAGRLEVQPIPTTTTQIPVTREMLDLGVVFKARTIRETAEHHFPEVFQPGGGTGAS